MVRKCARIYHTLGDLHNFRLVDQQLCLAAYRDEELLLQVLQDDPSEPYSRVELATALFWLNRNLALAQERFGNRDSAIDRMDRALRISEEFRDLPVDPSVFSSGYELLILWLEEAQRHAEAAAVGARSQNLGADSSLDR